LERIGWVGRMGWVVLIALASAMLLAVPQALAAAPGPRVPCADKSDSSARLDLKVLAGDTGLLEDAFGYYAVPSGTPRGLVIFAHGHSNSAWKWRPVVEQVARQLGVISVAMDYRRQTFPAGDITQDSYGWRVREGAEDSIAAAQLFEKKCMSRSTAPIVMYGVSMGGNTAGLAVASHAVRSSGAPLFDYWFDLEGATNVIETYLEARAVAGPPLYNQTGQTAVGEIEAEMGGPIEARPDVYQRHAVVTRAADIKASGIKGVVMVHGADDGTVPFNQSQEMFSKLVDQRLPTDFFTVARHGDSPSGNTLEDTFTVSANIPGYTSPFTGHGGENDTSHPVIGLGLDRLAVLLNGDVPKCFRAFVVDDGSVQPDPDATDLPACTS
jgi:hypothetical protein